VVQKLLELVCRRNLEKLGKQARESLECENGDELAILVVAQKARLLIAL
jgi:hypothetical protein